jgi:hypothetical protein
MPPVLGSRLKLEFPKIRRKSDRGAMRDRMARLVADAKTEQEANAAKPFADYDAKLGVDEQTSRRDRTSSGSSIIRWCHSRAKALAAAPGRAVLDRSANSRKWGREAGCSGFSGCSAGYACGPHWSARLPAARPCEIYHCSGDFLPICVRQMLS